MNMKEKIREKERLQALRAAIRSKVLATNDQRPITSPNGEEVKWLFDFRSIVLEPEYLDSIAELFWEHCRDRYPFQVGGQEVAAIPLVAAIVMKSVERGTPVNGFFLRKSRKKSGLMNMIEGTLNDHPIILVDDLINSGNTFGRQLEALCDERKVVSDIFVLLRFREEDAYKFITNRDVALTSVFTLTDFGLDLLDTPTPSHRNSFDVTWKFQSSDPNYFYVLPKSAPAVDDERIYFGADNGNFWALNQTNGSTAWRYKVGWKARGKSIFSSPALHNGVVYFGSYDGNVYALDAKTGKKKWVFMEADWIGSSPAVAPDLDLLYIGLEFGLIKKRGGIAALDLKTGEKKWDVSMPEYTHSSPCYIRERNEVVIGSNNSCAYLFNAKNGKLKWKLQTGGEIKESFAYDDKRGLILFGSFDGKVYAVNAEHGDIAFTYQTKAGIYSTPLVFNDAAYVASLDKRLYKFDLDTGALAWTFEMSGRIFASPVEIDGDIYVGSNDGRLYEIDPETGKNTRIFQATERITSKIAFNAETKRFFVPTFANELYCLEKRVA